MHRVTNGMIAENTLRNISAAAARLAKANEAVASNMKIQLASDDTTVATRAVTYRSYVAQVEQYQDNADLASAWQKSTDSALSSLSEDITSLKELATAAASDTVTDEDRENYATDVQSYLQDIITIMNTDETGSYIFGGYSTGEEPYELVTTDIGDTVTFKGDYLSLGGVISSDMSDEDIVAFFTASTGEIYNSLSEAANDAYTAYTTAQTAADADSTDVILAAKAASALTTYNTISAAVTTYGGTANLTDAATSAESDYVTIKAAIATYGGTTTLSDAADDAQEITDTLTAAITTYSDSTTLTSAANSAYTAYETAQAAADADPTDTGLADTASAALATYNILSAAVTTYGSTATLSEAAEEATVTSDALVSAVTAYGGTTTLTDVAAAAKTTYQTLTSADNANAQSINYNVGFGSEVTVNIEGQDITGEGNSSIFNTIQKLLLALNGDTTYKTATMDSSGNVTVTTNSLDISDLIDELSTALSKVTKAQGTLGVRMNQLSSISDRLDDAYEAYSSLMTDNENIDTAAAATELTSAEYTYEAALAVGAKVISKSLIDYIA
ncbi:Flagellar hook-associated protein 3 [Sporomusa ovata DSM 2662]|uniref:Flagellin n=1 Tax=Sporomusa ovata TaxID=2378 RepID=A0A0U1KXX3_9FIRM|nr:flagellin [Sporomusa ovata]EQB28341.1 flagellar hook-associated protein FlgL [Sporomusa ovata DSM 2662]CQR71979.1 Flagellar hook-associated protein FlgL [Sporomusa ovata]